MDAQGKEVDKQLLARVRAGDEQAFTILFRKYYNAVYVTAYRIVEDTHLADDVSNEVFIGLWNKSPQIDVHTSLEAYLRRMAANAAINFLKKEKLLLFESQELDQIVETYGEQHQVSEDEMTDREQLQERLLKAVEELPDRCRLVFKLHRFEKYSHKEIAEMLGISTSTIENQITKAMSLIRNSMQKYRYVYLWLVNFYFFNAVS